MIRLALGGQPKMETQLSGRVEYSSLVLTLCLVARIYNLTKFVRFHKARGGNMCKVDQQALSYVKVLSETHLYRAKRVEKYIRSKAFVSFHYMQFSIRLAG